MFRHKNVAAGAVVALILGADPSCVNPASSGQSSASPGTIQITVSNAPLSEIYIAKQGESYGANLLAGTYQSTGTTFAKQVDGGCAYSVKVQISDAGNPNVTFATVNVGPGQTRGLWSHESCSYAGAGVMCIAYLDIVN